jgi:hypothetical protein
LSENESPAQPETETGSLWGPRRRTSFEPAPSESLPPVVASELPENDSSIATVPPAAAEAAGGGTLEGSGETDRSMTDGVGIGSGSSVKVLPGKIVIFQMGADPEVAAELAELAQEARERANRTLGSSVSSMARDLSSSIRLPQGKAVWIGVALAVILLLGVAVLSTSSDGTGAPGYASPYTGSQGSTQRSRPAATTSPSYQPYTSSPPTASASGLVSLSDQAANSLFSQAILDLLERHFVAINNKSYDGWRSTVVTRRSTQQGAADWARGYRSTSDRNVVVNSITSSGSDSVVVSLSFISTQNPADAPPDLQVGQICWSSAWPVENVSSGGLIGTPPRGTTSGRPCS